MPWRFALSLGLLGLTLASTACPSQSRTSEQPDDHRPLDERPEVDAPAVCQAGCDRLERCVPELTSELDTDPAVISERLALSCGPVCSDFDGQTASLAVRDCLNLDSCDAYWGCVGSEVARPWLAAVAPVGERSCENLCSQASACALAKVCEDDARKSKSKPGWFGGGDDSSERSAEGSTCDDGARRTELEERCLLQCDATPTETQARFELVGCLDHVTCGGMLQCLDSWSETDYRDVSGPIPGISETCDAFCTRAIACGAEAVEHAETLTPEAIEELKQTMTSTLVECAVQCGKELGRPGARERFETCTESETCEAYRACANEV